MLTISELAAYAGVTVKAVRHYHRIGLLPEPPRDRSGYRAYDAAAVVALIRIRTLAGAGVPLARVHELLEAEPDAFGEEISRIDAKLRLEIRRLKDHRRRIAGLASGDSLALPPSVTAYLGRLRELGVDGQVLELERDGWIMIAAQLPHTVDALIDQKHAELDDPDMVRLYRLLTQAVHWSEDDPRVVEIADVLELLLERAAAAGQSGDDDFDEVLVDLLDAKTLASSPLAPRLLSILRERGWDGWTRVHRIGESTPGAGEGETA